MRGNTECPGGECAARETFQQLTGRDHADSFERVVLKTTEVVYRAESRSGVPKVKIIVCISQDLILQTTSVRSQGWMSDEGSHCGPLHPLA